MQEGPLLWARKRRKLRSLVAVVVEVRRSEKAWGRPGLSLLATRTPVLGPQQAVCSMLEVRAA